MAVCISGYPNKRAAHVAMNTVRSWLEDEENLSSVSVDVAIP